jgi:hypothetical protein
VKTIKTGPTGRFRFDAVVDDSYLRIYSTDYVSMEVDDLAPFREDLTITLKKYGELEGQVLDAETGRPIPKFELELRIAFGAWLEAGRPAVNTTDGQFNQAYIFDDEEGRFRLGNMAAGYPMYLVIRAPGYPPNAFGPYWFGSETDPPPPLFELSDDAVTLSGIVVDESFAPQPFRELKCLVRITEPMEEGDKDRELLLASRSLVTEADGSFRLDQLPPNRPIELQCDVGGTEPECRVRGLEKFVEGDVAYVAIRLEGDRATVIEDLQ